jgi:hypothetical protein
MWRPVVLDLLGLGIEGGEGADAGEQHPHRVRVVAEALEELLEVLVHVGVDRDLVLPLVELLLRGQLAVDEQVGHLEVGRVVAQLLDGIAAVLEHAGLAVDEGDLAATGGRVRERRVVRHQAEVVLVDLDPAKVHRLHGAVRDLELVGLAGPVVLHGQGVLLVSRGYRAVAVPCLRLLVCHGGLLARCSQTIVAYPGGGVGRTTTSGRATGSGVP